MDLPDPDSPTSPTASPSPMVIDIRRTACTGPRLVKKFLSTPSNSSRRSAVTAPLRSPPGAQPRSGLNFYLKVRLR